MELKPSDSLAAVNLATLLIYQNNWTQAAELASRAGLTPEQITDAQARAAKIGKAQATPLASVERVAPLRDAPLPEQTDRQSTGVRP
ncbi:hypothetical protein APX70_00913 [Pseudomonas syringae pv. maculicola]|nr:hypothetical protein APX70_00913 [Pseudomonas syringae pv. maculicola]